MPKYFFDPDSEQLRNDHVEISGDTAHHMQNVLRMQVGDIVTLCDGHNKDYTAVIEKYETRAKQPTVMFKVLESCASGTELQTQVTLYQALPKGDKLELVIQKCVELGVAKIVPVITSRTIQSKVSDGKKTMRYNRIAESAAGQSMRGVIPKVCEAITFKDALILNFSNATEHELTMVAYENEKETTLRHVLGKGATSRINIWVGPEGGFAKEEVDALANHGAVPITLGARVLRTETAAIALMAQIACLIQDSEME